MKCFKGGKNLDKTFEASSTQLGCTKVVPTLDTPIGDSYSAIWCSSFLAAWKVLCTDVGDDISLDDAPKTLKLLNRADDPSPYVPEGSLFAAAGSMNKGVVDRIREGLQTLFPAKSSPSFSGIADDSLVAYSYLQANVSFTLPYFQSRKAMEFTDSNGHMVKVMAFGIRPQDEYAYYQLRRQPSVLFRDGDPCDPDLEFALDLCAESSPSQIIVARIGKEPSLADALKRLRKEEKKIRKLEKENPEYARYVRGIGPNDVLLVPDLHWEISHRYSELEGKHLRNRGLEGQNLDIAQQDIMFRLDRSGAELESEAQVVCLPVPTFFVLDRPFLILMRKRGADMPYFAMWVDNTELLTPWEG